MDYLKLRDPAETSMTIGASLEAVNRRRELPAFQLCHEVIEEVQRFSAGRHFSDDVCLVAMEVGPMGM